MKRTDENCMVGRVLMAEVSGWRVRGGQRLGWMGGVKMPFVSREMKGGG